MIYCRILGCHQMFSGAQNSGRSVYSCLVSLFGRRFGFKLLSSSNSNPSSRCFPKLVSPWILFARHAPSPCLLVLRHHSDEACTPIIVKVHYPFPGCPCHPCILYVLQRDRLIFAEFLCKCNCWSFTVRPRQ